MKLKKRLSPLVGLSLPAFVYIVFVILSDGRLANWSMFLAMFQQCIYTAVISFAIYSLEAMGLWEMTSVSVFNFSLILAGNLALNYQLGLAGMLVLLLVFNVAFCMINYVIYSVTRIPSMILNFAIVMIYENTAILFFIGIFNAPSEWTFFSRPPWCYIIFAVSFAMLIVIGRTKFGYNVQAIGHNQRLAETAGINIRKTLFKAYLLEGVLLVPAALIKLSQNGGATAVTGLSTTTTAFDATVACMVGHCLRRFCHPLLGTFIGAFSIKILLSGLLALGLDASMQNVGKGLFLIVFLVLSYNMERVSVGIERKKKASEIQAKIQAEAK